MSDYSEAQLDYEDKNSSWYKAFYLIPNNSTVMDIGCSVGTFGEQLIKHKNCIVDGVEVDTDDFMKAKTKLRNVYRLNIEQDNLPQGVKYDVVFMGDVIEHLAQPIPALRKIRNIINKNGKLVFSIPNITHMSVRLMLLKGNIQYGKTGLLDETHLHFYNQEEIVRVFTAAGFKITQLDYVEKYIPREVLQKEFKEIGLTMEPEFEERAQSVNAAAYQFVGVAKKGNIRDQELPLKSPADLASEYISELHKSYKNQLEKIQRTLAQEVNKHKETKRQLNRVLDSHSFKLGYLLTKIPRSMKLLLHRLAGETRQHRSAKRLQKLIRKKYGIKNGKLRHRHRVGIVIRSFYYPTSSTFVRLISPFSSKLLQPIASFYLINGEKPILQGKTDSVIVQRTAMAHVNDAISLVKNIKEQNIRLFVDTDDAFGELTENHSQHKLQNERVEALNYIIRHADEIWFSTEPLKNLYKLENSKVIKNTLDNKVWHRLRDQLTHQHIEASKPLRIVYMGTTTHEGDFSLIIPVMRRLYETYPGEFELHVIGVSIMLDEYPWMVLQKPRSALYPNFVEWFNELEQYDVGLSPLQNSRFNSNKSDIKCLDYMACGIRPLVSDVEAYNNRELDGLITRVKNTEQDWYRALEKEIIHKVRNRKKTQAWSQKASNYILTKRSPETAAKSIKESLGL